LQGFAAYRAIVLTNQKSHIAAGARTFAAAAHRKPFE
jgi:hypothetical protein